jgi:hypothetical protein
MWAADVEMAKAIADHIMKQLRPQEQNNTSPVREPPFKPEKAKKNETHIDMLQRRNRDDVRAGRAVSASVLKPPPPRPPRAPGQQQLRSNGLWWHWR